MANFSFSLRLALGLLPQTTKIENKKNQLENELEKLNEIANSDLLAEYYELERYIQSQEFKNAKASIRSLNYKKSEEYRQEKKLLKLEKSTSIKNYFKVLQSADYQNLEKEENEKTEKFKKSKEYQFFLETEKSAELNEYKQLKEIINSEAFLNTKNYLEDKERYKKTEEYAKESRYIELSKNADIIWYLKNKNTKKFDEIKKWKITFEENFASQQIDEQKWMNSYFWGKMLLNDRYVLAGDKHYYTDNKNINLTGNLLKIITKKENAKGKVWHPKTGFSEQNFDYTSGMLSTAHSFRQKYGKFEAKIKIDSETPVFQAFWLKGERILPEIDIFKFNTHENKKMLMTSAVGNAEKHKEKSTKFNGGSLAKDFYIYSIDWTPERITWKINDIEVYSISEEIPNEPMYILLSAGINKEVNNTNIQSNYEIDWIKCYEKIN